MAVVLLTALVFYVLVPLAGSWRLRRLWEKFRAKALDALDAGDIGFSHLQSDSVLPGHPLRLIGRLEAFEGEDRLWIGNDQISAAVSLLGTPVYFLDEQFSHDGLTVEPPRKAEAASLGALPEGTHFLVAGPVSRDSQGQVQFAAGPDHPLLVLAFEGDPQTVLTRAIYSGRPVVDHWNSWTPVSLAIGILLLLTAAYAGLRAGEDRSVGLVSLSLALLPATFFLPPGILFFYGFTQIWAQGREHRASADLGRAEHLPGAQITQWIARARWYESAAQGLLALGMVGNTLLLVALLGLWVP